MRRWRRRGWLRKLRTMNIQRRQRHSGVTLSDVLQDRNFLPLVANVALCEVDHPQRGNVVLVATRQRKRNEAWVQKPALNLNDISNLQLPRDRRALRAAMRRNQPQKGSTCNSRKHSKFTNLIASTGFAPYWILGTADRGTEQQVCFLGFHTTRIPFQSLFSQKTVETTPNPLLESDLMTRHGFHDGS